MTGPLVSNRRGAATGSCQSRARPSEPAETSCWLLGRYASPSTASAGVSIDRFGIEVAFPEPDRVGLVAGRELAAVTAPGCADHVGGVTCQVLDAAPVVKSQILTDLPAAAANCLPSGLTARASTPPEDRRTF